MATTPWKLESRRQHPADAQGPQAALEQKEYFQTEAVRFLSELFGSFVFVFHFSEHS